MGRGVRAYYSDANWDGAATLVRPGARPLVGYIFAHNENASSRYLQVFNAAAVADVTLGTTEPVINAVITTDAQVTLDLDGVNFDLGLVIASTTTTRGATTGGAINIFIALE